MQSVKHAVTSVVQRGRIGRKKSFGLALVLALFVLPVATALAFYASTGTLTATTTLGNAANPITATQDATPAPMFFAGPNGTGATATTLNPGGSEEIHATIACATAPCTYAGTWTLNSWSADSGHAGCTSTAFPNQFTVVPNPSPTPVTISTNGGTTGAWVQWINMANLSINQGPCAGATITFNLSTP